MNVMSPINLKFFVKQGVDHPVEKEVVLLFSQS